MFRLVSKLKSLRGGLKRLNRHKFSNIKNETMITLTKIAEIQKEIHLDPLNEELHR